MHNLPEYSTQAPTIRYLPANIFSLKPRLTTIVYIFKILCFEKLLSLIYEIHDYIDVIKSDVNYVECWNDVTDFLRLHSFKLRWFLVFRMTFKNTILLYCAFPKLIILKYCYKKWFANNSNNFFFLNYVYCITIFCYCCNGEL